MPSMMVQVQVQVQVQVVAKVEQVVAREAFRVQGETGHGEAALLSSGRELLPRLQARCLRYASR